MSAVIITSDAFEYNGQKGICLKSRTRTKNQYGFGWEQVFWGLPDVVLSFFNNLSDDQFGRIVEDGPISILTVFTPDNPAEGSSGIITSTFDLLGNALQRDIREHKLATSSPIGPTILAKIDRVLNNVQRPNPDYNPAASASVSNSPYLPLETIAAAPSFERTLYNSLAQRRGNMSFNTSQFVFRATTIISHRAQISIAYGGMNSVYTTAAMITETSPPSGYVFSVQEAYDATFPTLPSGFTYGWLKQSPTVSTAPGNRMQVQVEYWLGEWEDWVYA